MPIRSLIVALLWLTYALSLGHSLLPHHHHDEHGKRTDNSLAKLHHGDNHDHDSDEATDEDWWFAHQHTPGVEWSQLTTPDEYQAPITAIAVMPTVLRFIPPVQWISRIIGWPPTQAKAPPDRYQFRPLRAPPLTFLLVD